MWRPTLCLLLAAFSWPVLAANPSLDIGQPGQAEQVTRSIEITLGDMYFEPESIQVKAGETVRFVLHNQGALLHEFSLGDAQMHTQHQAHMLMMQQMGMLDEQGLKPADHSPMDHSQMDHSMDHSMMAHDDNASVMLAAGQSAELIWTFNQPSRLEFACNLPGHYQAGMLGTLEVQP